ncbi:MAG: AlpA family phage regulatory protein [Spirochaetes bacterium]|jgi:predicted DNA-binding transcriptional regulator AlpA|nr:AlpA family phage regulatory protein [Spirochaetota bacterium]
MTWLRPAEAAKHLRVSRTQFYRLLKEPTFPKGKRLSQRCVVYNKEELDTWMTSKSQLSHASQQ